MGLQFGLEDVIANSQGNCLAIRNTRCLKKPGRFISHLRLAFKVAGYNARLRVDADKRRCLRVVQVEPRQFSAKRLDVRCNHMTGIPLRVGKRLQLFRVNPDTEVPSVFIGVVLLPALGQQRPVVVVTVSLMAPPVDVATRSGELKRDTPYLQSLLDPAQECEGLGSAAAITKREWLLSP